MKILEVHVDDTTTPPTVIIWRVFDADVLPHSGMWTAYIRIDGIPAAAITDLEAMGGQEIQGVTFDFATGDVTVPGRGTFTIPSNRYNFPTTAY